MWSDDERLSVFDADIVSDTVPILMSVVCNDDIACASCVLLDRHYVLDTCQMTSFTVFIDRVYDTDDFPWMSTDPLSCSDR